MFQKSFYLILLAVTIAGPASAMDDIDNYIRDHCGSACNGESDNCTQCYNAAIDLHDEQNPVSPEYNFDINNNYGKLKLVF